MTDPRALIQRLADALHSYKVAHPEHDDSPVAEARAYLAQPEPEPEPPSDEELLALMPQQMRDDLAAASRALAQQAGTAAGVFRVTFNTDALSFARAVLERWGR